MPRRIAVDLSVLRDSRNLRLLILGEVFSSLGAFAAPPPVAVIYLLAALLAAGSTVDNVTRSAIIPALAGHRLRAALSLNYGLYQIAAVVGPALGGLMIATLGVGAAFAADAAG